MSSFISELRRRNVFRVAIAYLVLSWVVIQIGDILLDLLGITAFGLRTVAAVLALGFVPALILAWVYELTPEGLKRDSQLRPEERAQQAGRRLNVVILVLLLLAAASFGLGRLSVGEPPTSPPAETAAETAAPSDSTPPTPANEPTGSMAVLPFLDLSSASDQGYFADGITEEILNVLARVDGLRVASRTSSFQFKGRTDLGLKEIVGQLGVRYVLEGSVRTAGETIRVTAQLIDSDNDQHLWSKTFDRTLSVENILAIQDEIARGIVGELGKNLGLGQAATVRFAAAADTEDLRAYQLYLEGRERFLDRHGGDINSIIAGLKEAVDRDADFAHAWNALAAAYAVAPAYLPSIQPDQVKRFGELAIEAAETALTLNPDLALALAVRGTGRAALGDTPDYDLYVTSLDRALALDPSEATLWNWRGQALADLGYFARAADDLLRCLELDPGNRVALTWLIRVRLFQNRLDEALETANQAADVRGNVGLLLAMALASNGQAAQAEPFFAVGPGGRLDTSQFFLPVLQKEVDYETRFEDLAALVEREFGFSMREQPPADAAYYFKKYDQIRPSRPADGENVWWYWIHDDFINSPEWQRLVVEQGLVAYWDRHGLPPHCRREADKRIFCEQHGGRGPA